MKKIVISTRWIRGFMSNSTKKSWKDSPHTVYWFSPRINNRSCTKNKGHHWTKQLFKVTFNCNLEFSLLQGLPLSPLVIPNRKRCNLWQCQLLSFKLRHRYSSDIIKMSMGIVKKNVADGQQKKCCWYNLKKVLQSSLLMGNCQ